MTWSRYSAAQDNFIRAHYKYDLSAEDIANVLGSTKSAIIGRARRLKLCSWNGRATKGKAPRRYVRKALEKRKLRFTDEQFAFIEVRHEQRVAITVIAWELNCSTRRIRYALKRLGLSTNQTTSFDRRAEAKRTIDSLDQARQRALGLIARDRLHSDLALATAMDMDTTQANRWYAEFAKAGLIAIRKHPRGREVRLNVPHDLATAAVPQIPTAEPEPPKQRNCLMCSRGFESRWAGERICTRCKDTRAWKEPLFHDGYECHLGGAR